MEQGCIQNISYEASGSLSNCNPFRTRLRLLLADAVIFSFPYYTQFFTLDCWNMEQIWEMDCAIN